MPCEPLTLAVASGKGGTGKTLVATNLAMLQARRGDRVVLVDCDVEAPNDSLFLASSEPVIEPVMMPLASVDPDACTVCGKCSAACAYGAIRVLGPSAVVFAELCHGCGLCERLCPSSAIHYVDLRVGEIHRAVAEGVEGLELASGLLDVGQNKTPEVIRSARDAARQIDADLTLLDTPPGVACAAVASLRGADGVILVTEPTPFGLHDLRLALDLAAGLELAAGVIVNRVGPTGDEIERECGGRGVPIIARIPFSREVAEAYAVGALAIDTVPAAEEWLDDVVETMRSLAVQRPVGGFDVDLGLGAAL